MDNHSRSSQGRIALNQCRHSFAMCSPALLMLTVTFLTDISSAIQVQSRLRINKCCKVHQILSADGKACVEANWSGNFSVKQHKYGDVIPPLDKKWVSRWLPPGLPLSNIRYVHIVLYDVNTTVSPVNASSLWNPALLQNEGLWRNTIVFKDHSFILRPKPGGGFREATYCVDSAALPLGPIAMRFKTACSKEECARKCCWDGYTLQKNEGKWKCEKDSQGYWSPSKSSLTKAFDPEFPHTFDVCSAVLDFRLPSCTSSCEHVRLLPFEEKYAQWARHSGGSHHFHFYTWDTCFDFYRSSSGSLHEGVFYCEYSRITRGVYWLLRPLCFLSALLLLASLLSIASDKSMRRNTHGHCLASHAASLLAFNIGQIGYYITISDRLDEGKKEDIPTDLQSVCKYFAVSLYFLLTAAWFWLTVLCANMALGFRLHTRRFNKDGRKKYLAISAFAWGLPAVFTITCSIIFTQPDKETTPVWYAPSLMETRVCYIEQFSTPGDYAERVPYIKSGTALFYYGPLCCLVLCNLVCLALTLRKVQYLKRGNSVLRREEDKIPLGQRHAERNNSPTAQTATGNVQTRGGRNRRDTTVDVETIKLYIKMILMTGSIELLSEVIMWLTTNDNEQRFTVLQIVLTYSYSRKDRDLAYRATGYVTDFFRAVVVTWLAAPEGGYLGLMRRLCRGKNEQEPARAGNAGRRKQNVA